MDTSTIEPRFGLDLRTDRGRQHIVWFIDEHDRRRFMEDALAGTTKMVLIDPPAIGTIENLDRVTAKILDSAGGTVSGLMLEEIGLDGHVVANTLWRIAGHLTRRRAVLCARCERPRAACDYDPCSANPITGHVRETTTPSELMTTAWKELEEAGLAPPIPGRPFLVVDCSCGRIYAVAMLSGDDEYAELEAAHKAHVTEMRTGC